ncbi:Calm4 [Symbiodinium natans]|uniref:Calm4 protein n=1 Tax=Symbiodinium natans TaxID=878477 RepID=A0A812I8M3_9DINO|nr:Calm4 [Symbiodinium natans]
MDGKVVTDIFRRFDKNRDGIITAEELLSVLSKLTLDKKDMTQLLKHIDTNGDGKIQYEEFVNWIVKAGSGDGQDQERSSVLEAHVQAAHHKLQRVRDSQTGAKRAEVFVNQLTSEKGRASLAELADKPPKGALAVCAAAHNLLWKSSKKIDWHTAKAMLVDLDQFLERLQTFEPAEIPDYVVQSYQQTLELPYFEFNRMVDSNYACACLASWVLASTCSAPRQTLLGQVVWGSGCVCVMEYIGP